MWVGWLTLALLPSCTAVAVVRRSGSLLAVLAKDSTHAPALESVITLLTNLVSQMDQDAASDEANFAAFEQWYEGQKLQSDEGIGSLNARLQELTAILVDLRAHLQSTATKVNKLSNDLAAEQDELSQASDKRTEEHDAFVKEQLDFDNSIAACDRAAELLTAHFGDGSPPENTKPAWLDLQSVMKTIRHAVQTLPKEKREGLLQTNSKQPADYFGATGSAMFDTFQPATGEAVTVVEQVKTLATTFAQDKGSAVTQENTLQKAFTALMSEKSRMISELTQQHAEHTSIVTTTNQGIAENESAEQASQTALRNEQAYALALTTQQTDTHNAYEARKADRAAELGAIHQAESILSGQAPAMLQTAPATCPQCAKATSMLRQEAAVLHSQLLEAAASETQSGASDALSSVISQLEDLVTRIDKEQEDEKAHADWCVKETSDTNTKKEKHETLVTDAHGSLATAASFITEKKEAYADTEEQIGTLDTSWQEQTSLRTKARADYGTEHQDYDDAISALKQAVLILEQHYSGQLALTKMHARSKPLLLQKIKQNPEWAADAPSSTANINAGYSSVGGGAVGALQRTTTEFEHGLSDLEGAEQVAQNDYAAAEARYNAARTELVDAGTRLTQQLQNAESNQDTFTDNLKSSEAEVAAASAYLSQLHASCQSLTQHYSDREAMRASERQAIVDAVATLRAQ